MPLRQLLYVYVITATINYIAVVETKELNKII